MNSRTPRRAARRAQLLELLAEADQLGHVAAPSAGRCAETDVEIFHPEKGHNAAPALRVCETCDVRAQCLAYALNAAEPYGIWGGASATERTWLRGVRAARSEQGAA